MALIECPECEEDISSTVKSCPQCGYRIKKMIFFIPITIILLLALSFGSIGYLYLSTESIRLQISSIGEINRDSELELESLKNELSQYNDLQKLFIFNEAEYHNAWVKFNALPKPIEITIDNANDYLKFEHTWENFSYNTGKDVFGFTHYYCTAELKINSSARNGELFEDVILTLGIDSGSGKTTHMEDLFLMYSGKFEMDLDSSGLGQISKVLNADYPIAPPNVLFMLKNENIYIKEISGIVYPSK